MKQEKAESKSSSWTEAAIGAACMIVCVSILVLAGIGFSSLFPKPIAWRDQNEGWQAQDFGGTNGTIRTFNIQFGFGDDGVMHWRMGGRKN